MPLPNIQSLVRRNHLATAGGICAILLWSLTIAFTRSISERLGPIAGATCVYTVAALLGIAAGMRRSSGKWPRITELPRAYLIGCGLLFVGYMLLLFLAVGLADNRNQVLEVGLINYLWPAFTLLFSVLILGNRARWWLIPGTLLALCGVFLVLTGGTAVTWLSFAGNLAKNPVAYLLGFAAAVFWGLYSTLTRKWAGGMESGAVVAFLTATAVVLFLIWFLMEEPSQWSVKVLGEVVILGAATFFAYSLWDNAMRAGNIVLVAACSYLTPFFSTVVTCLYLSVAPTFQLWLGCGILIVGSILSSISIRENKVINLSTQGVPSETDEPRH